MKIRSYQVGDEIAQVSIYNDAASNLPRFKPATVDEIRRRCRAADFDPSTRLYAEVDGRVVGYMTHQASGRVSYPWCRQDHLHLAEPLLEATLNALRQRGLRHIFAAYRADWTPPRDFFLAHGFQQTCEMLNYVLDVVEMPTPAARTTLHITELTREDVPAVYEMVKGFLRSPDVRSLERDLFENPYFSGSDLFALRNRSTGQPQAVCAIIRNEEYAEPRQVDPNMPCFRLGAFGTEGLTHKRIRGLFSLLAPDSRDLMSHGLDLLTFASRHLEQTDIGTLAAQVPSSVTHLARFYNHLFRRQGSFPLYGRDL